MENAYELGRREIDLIHLREELMDHRGLNMKKTCSGVRLQHVRLQNSTA
jgi:hypothetical protein